MSYVIILSALALVVAIVDAAGWIICAIRIRKLTRTSLALQQRMLRCEATVKESSPAAIAATVAALDASVAKVAASMRSQFGTVHAKIQALRPEDPPATNGERPSRDELRTKHLRPPFSIPGKQE